jgi:hypothetical protein
MADIITAGEATIEPTLILGYTAQRTSGNLVHEILGKAGPDVTLRPARLRSGTLTLGFESATSEADSKTAADLLATYDGVFSLISAERASVDMSWVVAEGGRISRDLDDLTRDAWVITVDFQEVEAA